MGLGIVAVGGGCWCDCDCGCYDGVWLLLLAIGLGFGGFYLGVFSGFCVWGFALWGLRVVGYFGLVCGALWWAVDCAWCGFVLRIVVFWWFGFVGLIGLWCVDFAAL